MAELSHIEREVLAQLDDRWQMARELRAGGRTQNQIVWGLQALRRRGRAATEKGDAENARLGQ